MSSADPQLTELEALYRARFERFLRVAVAIVGERERALDAVQDAFAGAIRARRGFRAEASLEAWVWRAVVNAAHSVRRRERNSLPLARGSEPASTNGRPAGERSDFRARIAALPERQRLAVFLRYYGDLEYAEIAYVLGIKTGTVSATLSAAHASLRRVITDPEEVR